MNGKTPLEPVFLDDDGPSEDLPPVPSIISSRDLFVFQKEAFAGEILAFDERNNREDN